MKNQKYLLLIALVVLAMLTRLIPHWPNFTAVGAVALLAGAKFRSGFLAYLVPLLALFLSDLVINNIIYAQFYEGFVFFTEGFYYLYAAFALSVWLGRKSLSRFKVGQFIMAGGASGLIFYLISNFGVWLGSPLYAQNFGGLITSYLAGLPFLLNQVLGTLLYGAILFGAYEFWAQRSGQLQKA